jgi:hypothetical protein
VLLRGFVHVLGAPGLAPSAPRKSRRRCGAIRSKPCYSSNGR